MMPGSDHGMSGWGWFAMSTSMVLLWVLIIVGGFLLFRSLGRTTGPAHHHHAAQSPEQVLAERFARGDIEEQEYRQRLTALHSTAPGPPRTKGG